MVSRREGHVTLAVSERTCWRKVKGLVVFEAMCRSVFKTRWPGLLDDPIAALEDPDLARDLVLDRVLDESKRIDVLELGARAEFRTAGFANGNVGIATKAALFHVSIADFQKLEDLFQPREVIVGFGRRADVRVRHDFDKRHAAAIEIQVSVAAGIRKTFVQRLAGILFHMDALHADLLVIPIDEYLDEAVLSQGPVIL